MDKIKCHLYLVIVNGSFKEGYRGIIPDFPGCTFEIYSLNNVRERAIEAGNKYITDRIASGTFVLGPGYNHDFIFDQIAKENSLMFFIPLTADNLEFINMRIDIPIDVLRKVDEKGLELNQSRSEVIISIVREHFNK